MKEFKTVPLDQIIPYWRNPRDNREAVEKVKTSIQAYGFQAPILVDSEMVIIAGHSRYKALRELGMTEAEVVITDMDKKKAKEYRIIDNRTSEYAKWDENLSLELKEFDDLFLADFFFPNIKLDVEFQDSDFDVTPEAFSEAENKQANVISDLFGQQEQKQPKLNVPCPYCGNTISLLRSEIERLGNWTKNEAE